MSHDVQIFIELVALYLLWICGPLVPAVLIYRLFPETQVTATGPLSGLTVRATGAFAAYAVTFLMTYPLAVKIYSAFGSQLKPVWSLKAEVIASDEAGNPITYANFYDGMTISFTPDFQVIADRSVELQVPLDSEGRSWPKITFQIPNYGGVTIDPMDYRDTMEIDRFNKEIEIHGAIPIQRFIPRSFGE
jgi:hypothetical protein